MRKWLGAKTLRWECLPLAQTCTQLTFNKLHLSVLSDVSCSGTLQVLEGKPIHVDCYGNLSPLSKSGQQLVFNFYSFKENRLPFNVKVRRSAPVVICLFPIQRWSLQRAEEALRRCVGGNKDRAAGWPRALEERPASQFSPWAERLEDVCGPRTSVMEASR